MTSPKILCRLNTKISQTMPLPGGIAHLTWEDVCFAVAGLDDPVAKSIILAKWPQQVDSIGVVHDAAEKYAITRSERRGWGIPQEQVVKMAKVAASEAISPMVCPRCKGAELLEPCERCFGGGVVSIPVRAYVSMLGISIGMWQRRYQARYAEILAWLLEKESDGLAHVMRRLG